ncbi:MAG TPA: hypothetical protein VLZ50_08500 [Terracidiphilus sp.]|nr:hypothetical protein [Terracidiphilus sp.]
MAAFLLHFGVDDCLRLPVLRNAGYRVEECPSIRRLKSALLQFPEPDAVAIAENDSIEKVEADKAISLVRAHGPAPLILFQDRKSFLESSEFNLVVPFRTHPRLWLSGLAGLIERGRMIQQRSKRLREEVAAAMEVSRRERERSAFLRDPSRRIDPDRQGTGWLGLVDGLLGATSRTPSSACMGRTPELVIGYDESSRPVSAVCSACGQAMPDHELPVITTDEMIWWFSTQFGFHLECKHGSRESVAVH